MANEEQLSILTRGIDVWNAWRDKYYADSHDIDVDLTEFRAGTLSLSDLRYFNLRKADLSRANLRGAHLEGANLMGAHLQGADLSYTVLWGTEFSGAGLSGCNFTRAQAGYTIFGSLDLRETIGLGDIVHDAPSIIGLNTIHYSKGKLPEVFLRGCGLSDWEIEMAKLYNPELTNEERSKSLYRIYDLQAAQAIQISPLFISYSHGDGLFVDKVGNHLNKRGVRFWRDVHNATAGRLEKVVDRAMRLNPTVLLVLSSNSLQSDWVEYEVRMARGLEKELKRDVLCPVALDDSWKSSPWPKRVMEQIMEYNILDFSHWKDDSQFDNMFRKLIDGLELFYKG